MLNKTNFNNNSKYLLINSKKINNNDEPNLVKTYTNNDGAKNILDPKVFALVNDRSRLSKKSIYELENLIFNKKLDKHDTASTKEWASSVYTYNKNYTKNLPMASNVLNNLLTGYFNLTRIIDNKKSNSNVILERKNTLNKTLVSKSEVKITNDKVNLTVYIYNRSKETLLRSFKRIVNPFNQKWRAFKKLRAFNPLNIKKIYFKKGRAFTLFNKKRRAFKKGRVFKSFNKKQRAFKKGRAFTFFNKKQRYIKKLKSLKKLGFLNLLKFFNMPKLANSKKLLKTQKLVKTQTLAERFGLVKLKLLAKRRVNKRRVNKRKKLILNKAVKFIRKVRSQIKEIKMEDQDIELLNNKENALFSHIIHTNDRASTMLILKYFSDYMQAIYWKKMLRLYYIREVVINNNKFKNWFLLGLKKTLTKLYNKKVELNIVNQKYFYLNSDIFIKAIATRLRDRNNRILIELKKALSRVAFAKIRTSFYKNKIKFKKKTSLGYKNKILNLNNIYNIIRYKHMQGVRIEGAGRLSLRLTAARSLSKKRSLGNLKNTQKISFDKNFSLLRGNVKPNVQYTILNAKTRNGAFGLKGWVNSN